MCGIAGYFRRSPAKSTDIRAMCAQIAHRGPDDEGVYTEGGCGIGMRRLSIIDLSTGHQPISNEDGTLWVVFNGEVYNYQGLRQELISKGHRFATNSDTETLLHLYEEEGPRGVARLRGMFAYAIWDSRRQSLYIARDRFGKKPLYYTLQPDGLYFASEMKCLRALGLPLDELEPDALRLYFQFLYIPDPHSPFKAVRKLPAASWMLYHADGRLQQERYWEMPVAVGQQAANLDESALEERVRAKFDESVKLRMIADVPLGAFLSGGIDSGSVVASMALQSDEPVRTFSIGFEEAEFNELPWARLIAEKYGTKHHEIIVKPDSVGLVERLVRHFDEPLGDSSAIPTYIVSEFAVQHVKVALSGDGGDELFAGYDSFRDVQASRRFDSIPGFARRLMGWTADRLPYSAYGKNYLRMVSRLTPLDRYIDHNSVPYYLRTRLFQPEWILPGDGAAIAQLLPHCFPAQPADIFSQALYFEATAKLTGDMLVKVDRMSMANSLEVRCPLLDHELAELAATIPPGLKIRNGRGKYILTKSLASRLPAAILTKPKTGFGVPLADWFRHSLRVFLHDHLTSRDFLERGLVSPAFVHVMLKEHDTGRRNHDHLLWALLMLELWFRDWQRPSLTVPSAVNALA